MSSESERISSFAHDLKHYLLMQKELARRLRSDDAEMRREALGKLERGLIKMLLEVNTLLLADRNQSGLLRVHPMRLDLNELIQEAMEGYESLYKASEVKLDLVLEESLPMVELDPAIFPSALHNLLDNALKYSDAGSSVVLQSSRSEQDPSLVNIVVADNGIGIPEQEREGIFTKHFRGSNTNRISGNGLGLYLTKHIVEAHNGNIHLERTSEFKTRFIIELQGIESK